jgi:class 3 adenylate cyclase
MLAVRMPNLPSGTVTFVFSDIEGSTTLLKQLGDDGYAALLATHRRLVRETFAAHDGQEIDTQGDAFFYSFTRARDAVAAAVAVQRAHEREAWPEGASVRIRLGLHTGEPAVGEDGYTGLDVVRASRIAAVARGGQVLLSETTRAIVVGDLPDGVELHALGEQRLRDIDRPEPVHELRIRGLTPPSAEAPGTSAADDMGPAQLQPEAGPLAGAPVWVREAAAQFMPIGQRASQAIEARVLAEIEAALRRPRERSTGTRPAPPGPSHPPSVADEIAKLRALHESGALTDEQYANAVDRAIGGG